jgi:23S rRNA pseudouridine1911/1915/1917 synthase
VRLDLALIRQYPGLSRRKARAAIEKGQVSVRGEVVREAGCAVDVSAAVAWDPNRPALPRIRFSLPILYQDDDIIIIDKPAGLLSVPTSPHDDREGTALARVREYVMRVRRKRPYTAAVHRLDRGTSGALAFALRPSVREALRALFRAHRIERRYLALVEGCPREKRGEVDIPIRNAYIGGRRGVARPGEASRAARTRWRLAEPLRGAALIEVELETGRQHQIRIHLARLGFPILGDSVYRPKRFGAPKIHVARPMLHARRLGFDHPESGARVVAESPLPADFIECLSRLSIKS